MDLEGLLRQAEQHEAALKIEIERLTRTLWETRGQVALLRNLIAQQQQQAPKAGES